MWRWPASGVVLLLVIAIGVTIWRYEAAIDDFEKAEDRHRTVVATVNAFDAALLERTGAAALFVANGDPKERKVVSEHNQEFDTTAQSARCARGGFTADVAALRSGDERLDSIETRMLSDGRAGREAAIKTYNASSTGWTRMSKRSRPRRRRPPKGSMPSAKDARHSGRDSPPTSSAVWP